MIHFGQDELAMLRHTADVMGDRVSDAGNGYSDGEDATVDRIERMGKSATGLLVITGDDTDLIDCARVFRQVVAAELAHWVPDASQRLLFRAALALGVTPPFDLLTSDPDCGAEPSWHNLTPDNVHGMPVERCRTCARLYPATMAD